MVSSTVFCLAYLNVKLLRQGLSLHGCLLSASYNGAPIWVGNIKKKNPVSRVAALKALH